MIVSGVLYPNISCNFCGFRHPLEWSCDKAKATAEHSRTVNETNMPVGPDMNGLLYVCKQLVKTHDVADFDSYAFQCAFRDFREIVDQLPEHNSDVAQLLCEACRILENYCGEDINSVSPELQAWWKEYQKRDMLKR